VSTATAQTGPDDAQLDTGNIADTGSRHLNLALVVISTAQLMLVLDELIVNTALPHLQQGLHFSGTTLEWVVTAYALTFGGLLMVGGRAGDVLGRRRVFIAGILVFTAASLLGGLATAEWWLLGARALQGVGAAMAAPAALSLITVTFPEGRLRARALGVYAAMTGAGGSIGLIIGGLLTTYASWRWVFFVNVPIGLALAFATPFAIPETRRHPRPLDLPGAIAGTAAFTLLVYGLTRAATGPDGISHWSDSATISCLAGAMIALVAFIVIESRTEYPLMPLRIFANRNRAGAYLMIVCVATALFGTFFFLTLFMQTVWGWSALKAGAAYLPLSMGIIVVAGICSVLVNRIGARTLLTVGALVGAGGLFWLSRIGEHSTYLSSMFGPMLVVAAGAGMIFVPITMTVVAGVSEEDTGVASSMFNAGQQIGGAVGLATIGSVVWTTVNNNITHHLAAAHTAPTPGSPIYNHALSHGASIGLGIGAGAAMLALVIAIVTIRVRRQDLPAGPVIP